MNGLGMATTRAADHENVSLRVTCGADGVEKLILTTRVEGIDPVAANKLTGLRMPMRLEFGNGSSFDVTSAIISDARQGEALGHQIVDLTPQLMRAIETSGGLDIQNMNERYHFSLLGADSAIRQLRCLP
jgi:hypothetical protein